MQAVQHDRRCLLARLHYHAAYEELRVHLRATIRAIKPSGIELPKFNLLISLSS